MARTYICRTDSFILWVFSKGSGARDPCFSKAASTVYFLFSFHDQVHLQTQQKAELRLVGMGVKVVRTYGFLALYNGLSASLLRQVHDEKCAAG